MSVLKTYPEGTASAPSRTYRIHDGRIEGTIDGLDAVRQSIELILTTERFQWQIFSSDYGVELDELIGERRPAYVEADIERRITDALLEDDRITGVKDFALTFGGEIARVSLTAVTAFGEASIERSVPLG